MELLGHPIGVCSWSLHESRAASLIPVLKDIGLSHVQLAIGPLLPLSQAEQKAEFQRYEDAGITIVAGMIGFEGEDYSTIARIHDTGGYVPASFYNDRREVTKRAAAVTAAAGINLLTTHVGFIPPMTDPSYNGAMSRIRQVADDLKAEGLTLGLETGQEPADHLLVFLNSLGAHNVVINFDPGNMILYGAGDPVEAVTLLGKHVGHVHLKDAVASAKPGTEWGQEMAFGAGQVGAKKFLSALRATGYKGPLTFEREVGPDRVGDLKSGVEAVRKALS